MVDEPVGHTGLVGDVRHPAAVEAPAREDAHGGIEDLTATVLAQSLDESIRRLLAPWRTGMPDRPALATPPTALLRGGRPLKRWCWVGVFAEELMLCAAVAHVGPLRFEWWAVWGRRARTLVESSSRTRRHVSLSGDRVQVHDDPYSMRLELSGGVGVETISPHGRQPIWTCKRPATADGTVVFGDRRFELRDAPAFVDESAGHHARDTAWRWSAGAGADADGTPVFWNLVEGLHDDPVASERTVWIAGEPHHVEPLPFATDLSAVGDLRFTPEATRVHREDRWLLATDYEQPFGAFAGTLPHAGPVTGLGVMERHAARW